MTDIGIGEASNYVISILNKLLARKVKCGNDLIVNTLFDVSKHTLNVYTALNGIKSRKKRIRNKRSVSAVENTNLSCSVHLKIVGNYNVKSALIKRKLTEEILISLDYPKVEIFTGVDHLIVKSDVDLLFLGVTGIDTVNKGVGKYVLLLYESLEVCTEIPKVSILKNALLEVVTVSVDKLARKENKSVKSKLKATLKKKLIQ